MKHWGILKHLVELPFNTEFQCDRLIACKMNSSAFLAF